MAKARMGIADVSCSRLRFEPGDRIIVRTNGQLDQSQQAHLRKSICKFAGCEVEVLIINILQMDISVEKPRILGLGT